MEFLGSFAYVVGTGPERARGRQYLQWQLDQNGAEGRTLAITSAELEARDDVTIMQITVAEQNLLDGNALRTIEEATSTLIFYREFGVEQLLRAGTTIEVCRGGRNITADVLEVSIGDTVTLLLKPREDSEAQASAQNAAIVPLLIFGPDAPSGESGRSAAEKMVREAIDNPAQAWPADTQAWPAEESSKKWQEPSWDSKKSHGSHDQSWDSKQQEQSWDNKKSHASKEQSWDNKHQDKKTQRQDQSWEKPQRSQEWDRGGGRKEQVYPPPSWDKHQDSRSKKSNAPDGSWDNWKGVSSQNDDNWKGVSNQNGSGGNRKEDSWADWNSRGGTSGSWNSGGGQRGYR
eukprot:gnl/TRDRNA2_/TRDRNA2_169071_c2_seq1.p1 gnl/TRDRNA2_/TRDRNA2_169071_c2~~gnl/TRDRNA2_/TRDRNA2_169071_c2_seq1.p1  ORF type:complete len:358 (-),score=78.64 gnl/TRDRNA2_/TRDRNA2_169071_c2_seq1:60-1097(-)